LKLLLNGGGGEI